MPLIRLILPFHLQTLAQCPREVKVSVETPPTILAAIRALETAYPMLRGTVREHDSLRRRPLVRFFAAGEDLSHEPLDTPLPEVVVSGSEPFMIVGAIAGG